MNADQFADLKRQHEAWLRAGYDGHNYKGGKTTSAQLRGRRARRKARRRLAAMVRE